jgi:hypothetical protein
LIKDYVRQGTIRVDVINGPITEHHKNQSRDVVIPKDLLEGRKSLQTSATANFGISPSLKAQLDEEMQQKNQQNAQNQGRSV